MRANTIQPHSLPSHAELSRSRRRCVCYLLPELCHLSTPDDYSPPEPPLPIPNRTVKRRRADDSTDCPCESRSLSGTHKPKGPVIDRAFWLCCNRGSVGRLDAMLLTPPNPYGGQ